MSDDELWHKDSQAFGWEMPAAAWWKRLPIIRHFRAAYATMQVRRHNLFWIAAGKIPSGYDNWVVYGIARGFERTP